ncbi:MAG: hypothetical protein AAGA23_07295 [Pseudomonadota bacterium]
MDIAQKEFWHRHSDEVGLLKAGVSIQSHQLYSLRGHRAANIVPSMLLPYELGLLYALARDRFTGAGKIVDLGPLLGASTFCFSRGLEDNPRLNESMKIQSIYSFDLFRYRGYEKFLGNAPVDNATGNLLPAFIRNLRDYLEYVVINQGNFLTWQWDGQPVEILFVDIAKSWRLNTHVIQQFFPCLEPDRSVLVQQDYVHFNEYWIHITMEWFKDYFRYCGVLKGASTYYELLRPIPVDQCQVDLEQLPFDQKWDLLSLAREKMPKPAQEVMKTAAAKCAIEHDQWALAEATLAEVDTSRLTDDPSQDFSGIAKDNLKKVTRLLAAKRG